jgi:hypothetical protein
MHCGAERPMIRLLAVLAVGACTATADADAPNLEREALVTWREDHPDFGGFSAVEVLDEGRRFVAVTDRGHWATGEMQREDGRLVGVVMTGIGPLLGVQGRPLRGDDADAEGLALHPDGSFYVSFEGYHRVRRYRAIDGPAETVEGHPDFPRLQRNSGLEALAIDAGGAIHAIPERSGALDRPFPVYRKRGGAWDRAASIVRDGEFLVTGADFGPDGRLYVVERQFALLGFRTRVRRFTLGEEGVHDGETLIETGWMELDNMEGISVWADEDGVVRITLLSDDNFFPLQRTLFAEYVVPD